MRCPRVWIVVLALGVLWVSRAAAQTEEAPAVGAGQGGYGPPPVAPEPIAPVEPTAEEPPPPPPPSYPPPEPEPAPAEEAASTERAGPDPAFKDWGEPGADPPPPPAPPFQVAAMVGVGASFDDIPGGVNPLGFGFGARGDMRLLPELAVGVRFAYFVGGSASLPSGDFSVSSWLLAGEASYVIPISGMVVEPGIALGVAARAVDGRSRFAGDGAAGFVPGSADDADVGLYVAPGAALTVPMTLFTPALEPFFIGADARIGFVFGEEVSGSFELMIQAGLRF